MVILRTSWAVSPIRNGRVGSATPSQVSHEAPGLGPTAPQVLHQDSPETPQELKSPKNMLSAASVGWVLVSGTVFDVEVHALFSRVRKLLFRNPAWNRKLAGGTPRLPHC
jgi:hypothetical protein